MISSSPSLPPLSYPAFTPPLLTCTPHGWPRGQPRGWAWQPLHQIHKILVRILIRMLYGRLRLLGWVIAISPVAPVKAFLATEGRDMHTALQAISVDVCGDEGQQKQAKMRHSSLGVGPYIGPHPRSKIYLEHG